VVSGELVQWDEVRIGGSYISSSDLRLHFGLAHRERVDLLEVHWPGGTTERFRDIPANRFVTIEQGKGIARTEPARKQS
ncbi:MAG: ASPIC/UnbV domain-containing protein, partial [Bryobacteraceae bacterium]|nr:ASPIC/UnbV domain-containing protein [Bryobacteraceae bacterium]